MNRPQEFAEFRIIRRKITYISPDGEEILRCKICGRIMIRPYEMMNEGFFICVSGPVCPLGLPEKEKPLFRLEQGHLTAPGKG